jgi:hypothetical protein
MFALYAARPNPENQLASLVVGERPEPEVRDALGSGQNLTCKS